DLLHLTDEVQLGRRVALQAQEIGRVERALVERVARLDLLALRDQQARAPRQLHRLRVLVVGRLVGDDRHLRPAIGLLAVDAAGLLRERRRALGVARLEDLRDAREAVRDVRTGDTAGVEGPHRQLGTGLADRLRGDA